MLLDLERKFSEVKATLFFIFIGFSIYLFIECDELYTKVEKNLPVKNF